MEPASIIVRSNDLAVPIPDPGPAAQPGDLNPELLAASIWTDDMVQRAGIPVVDVPFVSIGGGIGSFSLVDTLRIAGIAPEPDPGPYQPRHTVADLRIPHAGQPDPPPGTPPVRLVGHARQRLGVSLLRAA